MDVEAAVFPGVEHLNAFGREEFLLDQEVDDLGAEEFFQGLERGVGQGMEGVAGCRPEAAGAASGEPGASAWGCGWWVMASGAGAVRMRATYGMGTPPMRLNGPVTIKCPSS